MTHPTIKLSDTSELVFVEVPEDAYDISFPLVEHQLEWLARQGGEYFPDLTWSECKILPKGFNYTILGEVKSNGDESKELLDWWKVNGTVYHPAYEAERNGINLPSEGNKWIVLKKELI